MTKNYHPMERVKHQSGSALIAVLLVLLVVSILGVGGAQIALMGERSARNDRDMQIAWQAAEAALKDAELDMTTSSRSAFFNDSNSSNFIQGCGTTGSTLGLCAATVAGKPAWLTVNMADSAAPVVPYGGITGQVFASGVTGIQPVKPPVYLIELVPDPSSFDQATGAQPMVYRVTAMGFGPRPEIQAVVQMIYRV
jgi:type IV pilus assembly protein PilX